MRRRNHGCCNAKSTHRPTTHIARVLHTLALAIDSSVSSETELTTDHRLDRLEMKLEEQAAASRSAFQELHDRFENHERVIQERMEEVFRLLHQVLAHKVQSISGSG